MAGPGIAPALGPNHEAVIVPEPPRARNRHRPGETGRKSIRCKALMQWTGRLGRSVGGWPISEAAKALGGGRRCDS